MRNYRLIGVFLSVTLLLSLFSATIFALEVTNDSVNSCKEINDEVIVDTADVGKFESVTVELSCVPNAEKYIGKFM